MIIWWYFWSKNRTYKHVRILMHILSAWYLKICFTATCTYVRVSHSVIQSKTKAVFIHLTSFNIILYLRWLHFHCSCWVTLDRDPLLKLHSKTCFFKIQQIHITQLILCWVVMASAHYSTRTVVVAVLMYQNIRC